MAKLLSLANLLSGHVKCVFVCVCVFFKIKISFQQIVNNADTLGLVFSTVYIG